jgi:hypothetical protein
MLLVFPILPPIHILGARHPFQPNFSVPPIYLTVPINICNARVRTSGRASRVGRLSWRHTRRGAHYNLIPIRTTTRTPSTTRPFLHPFFATSTSIRADAGNGCSPVPRRRRRAWRRPPVRGAAGGGDGAAALHPPRPLCAQTPPRSWSGNLGPARLSLAPPAPLPASAAAARSLTAPAWIRPLPTLI